jgi:hypothetical protein
MPELVEDQERDHNEDADVDVDEGTSTVGSIDQCPLLSVTAAAMCWTSGFANLSGCVIVTNDNDKLW